MNSRDTVKKTHSTVTTYCRNSLISYLKPFVCKHCEILRVCFFCLFFWIYWANLQWRCLLPISTRKITEKYSWVIDSKQRRAEMRASGLEELQMVLHFNRNACKKKKKYDSLSAVFAVEAENPPLSPQCRERKWIFVLRKKRILFRFCAKLP